MAENVPNDDVLRRVLASQRLLLEQTQKILAQQEASKKEQKSTVEKIPLILRVSSAWLLSLANNTSVTGVILSKLVRMNTSWKNNR